MCKICQYFSFINLLYPIRLAAHERKVSFSRTMRKKEKIIYDFPNVTSQDDCRAGGSLI